MKIEFPSYKTQVIIDFTKEASHLATYERMMKIVRAEYPGHWEDRKYISRHTGSGLETKYGNAYVDFVTETDAKRFAESCRDIPGIDSVICLDNCGFPITLPNDWPGRRDYFNMTIDGISLLEAVNMLKNR